MIRQQPMRQRIRKGIILTTFILFPIIMNYFSPYVIIDGASQGIINGSFIVFGLMFLASLVLGRPGAGGSVQPAGCKKPRPASTTARSRQASATGSSGSSGRRGSESSSCRQFRQAAIGELISFT